VVAVVIWEFDGEDVRWSPAIGRYNDVAMAEAAVKLLRWERESEHLDNEIGEAKADSWCTIEGDRYEVGLCCVERVTAVESSLLVNCPSPLDNLDVAALTLATINGGVLCNEAIFASELLDEDATILPKRSTNERRPPKLKKQAV
jgi:hypothetical protein